MSLTYGGVDVAVYRGMSRAALDAAYNNSAAVLDSGERLAQWAVRSEAERASPGARLNLVYGPRPRNSLDYFAARNGAPLFVFLHGGYWQRNSKDIFAFLAEGPRAHGINVALVGYTLAPEARLSSIVEEIAQALDFLDKRAGDLAFDRDSVIVGGWSAGGHLAALALEHPLVCGGVSVSGIFDLEPIALSYINEKLGLDAAEVAALSPVRRLEGGANPLRLFVGGNELSELQRQSIVYAEAAVPRKSPVSLRILPGHNHFSILDELASAEGHITKELVQLVGATARR
jgi:arylformamidase